jgi:deoxyribonuclease-4
MKELLFGTAGVPISTKEHSTVEGIKRVKELGLGCMELEFVRGVKMKEDTAKEVNEVMKSEGVALTCHAPYYVNLNSQEKAKLEASKKRIIHSAKIASLCGAHSVTFHPAYYMKMEPGEVYKKVKEALEDVMAELRKKKIEIDIRPETTGKPTAFGTAEEIIQLSQEIKGVLPCIDFAHLHARTNGKMNSYDEFHGVLEQIERGLGKKALENMHIHVSGIKYSEKGEKHHLILRLADLKYKELIKAWKDFGIKGCVISESPNIEGDAMLMQKVYNSL